MKKSTIIMWETFSNDGVVLSSSGSYWHKIGTHINGKTMVTPEEAFWLCAYKKAIVCDEFSSQVHLENFELVVFALFPLRLTMVSHC
jgi:hypothetical protein